MHASIREALERSGAVIEPGGAQVKHFGDPQEELRCALESCVLTDRSDLGRLLAVGPDLLGLLHRLSTADLLTLAAGEGKPTVLTSPKGRIVERLFVHHLGQAGILLVGGRESSTRVEQHLRRYTVREDTGLTDASESTSQFGLVGPRAAEVIEAAGWSRPGPYQVVPAALAGTELQLLGQDGLSGEGFSVVAPAPLAGAVWSSLVQLVSTSGGCPAGDLALESHRVLKGLPASGHELTEDYNPLEAGLWEAVSFTKGCYVGQEIVARLRTYDKVSRALVGIELPAGTAPPPPGCRLLHEGREVGRLTSAVLPPGRQAPVGLGFVKRREIGDSLDLQLIAVDGATLSARIVRPPSSHQAG